MKPTERPVCLTIAGLDPSGGAGIVADIKTFTAFGCYAAAAVTSVTFQNTKGVFGAVHQTRESLRAQVEPVIDDFDIAAAKTGMLPTAELIEETALVLSQASIPNIVVDPVVRSTSGFDLIGDGALRTLIAVLFPIASVITPNIPEAERICCISIESDDDILRAGEKMLKMGALAVLIKGGHATEKKEAVDHLFTAGGYRRFAAAYVRTTATHGTGCALSAAIAANLSLNRDLSTSVEAAKNFVLAGLRKPSRPGSGNSPVNIPVIWPEE